MAQGKRKLPIRTKKIELTGDYEGWELTARTNPRLETLSKMSSAAYKDIVAGLAEVIIDWNFVDENGKELPAPDAESVGLLTVDLAMAAAQAINAAIMDVPGN